MVGISTYVYVKAKSKQPLYKKRKEQLQTQKTVAETKVKKLPSETENEENLISRSRTSLLERMHNDGDLRD